MSTTSPALRTSRAPNGAWKRPVAPAPGAPESAPLAPEPTPETPKSQEQLEREVDEAFQRMEADGGAPTTPEAQPAPAPAPRPLPPVAGPRPAARAGAPRTAAPRASTAPTPATTPERRRLLPTAPTPPNTDLGLQKIFLYGREKIGKSTFASQFPDAVFLMCEPGLNALNTYQVPIDSWPTFLEACAELAEHKHQFRTIVIDIVDILYQHCSAHVLGEYQVQHESDLDWGKGWKVVENEFSRVVSKLSVLGLGIILISHSELVTIRPKYAPEYTRIVPTLSKQARSFTMGLADHILYMDVDNGQQSDIRTISCRPTDLFEAGSRWPMPAQIALPEDQSQDYAVFKAHYDAAAASAAGGAA